MSFLGNPQSLVEVWKSRHADEVAAGRFDSAGQLGLCLQELQLHLREQQVMWRTFADEWPDEPRWLIVGRRGELHEVLWITESLYPVTTRDRVTTWMGTCHKNWNKRFLKQRRTNWQKFIDVTGYTHWAYVNPPIGLVWPAPGEGPQWP